MEIVKGSVCLAKGFKASGIYSGIRKNTSKLDLGLIISEKPCAVAAVYTKNKVFGAPITVTRENIKDGYAQGVIVNSGNANTCNIDGVEKAQKVCQLIAEVSSLKASDFVIASTGVIGKIFDLSPIEKNVKTLYQKLSVNGGEDMAEAILTTDTKRKEASVKLQIDGKLVTIGGCSKGSGMIHPNMATMLGFITSDIAISPKMLNKALSEAIKDTFNMVSVDGDTSTNDMVTVLANGMAENTIITKEDTNYQKFSSALYSVCESLSKQMAKDGEGATKLIECEVINAYSKQDAKIIAKSIITSSLVKTAMFGADANWGRILCAIGYAEAMVDIKKVKVELSSDKGIILVCDNGYGVEFSEEKAKEILMQDEIKILVTLCDGTAKATAWGCDLSYEYVKINGDYRT